MSNKTKFNNDWKEKFDWLREVKGDLFSANCSLCHKIFSIKNSGISQMKQHDRTEYHVKIIRVMKNNEHF